MTVEELVVQVYEDAGEPTDLYPYDENGDFHIHEDGTVKILALLNKAYRRLTNWKMPNGQIIRFTTCNKELAFNTKTLALTVSGVSGTSLTLSSGAFQIYEKYDLWIMEIGSERRLIRKYWGNSRLAQVHKAFDATITDGTAATLYKKFFNFAHWDSTIYHDGEIIRVDPQNEVLAIQSIYDVTNEQMLERVRRDDTSWSDFFGGRGDPGQYWQTGDGIEFDVAPEDGNVYVMRYYGMPETLEDEDQIPRIPDSWHEVLHMLASWYRLKTDRETDDAYALKRDIVDTIGMMTQQMERALDYEEGSLYIAEE